MGEHGQRWQTALPAAMVLAGLRVFGGRRAGVRTTPRARGSAVWHRDVAWARIGPMSTTVLIVDDHPSFRASARRMLEADGYEVVGEAEDGGTAMAAAQRLRPDLVLLDVRLPDIDGFEVATRLLDGNDGIPEIVLISSHDSTDLGGAIGASGARGFIPKSELSTDAIASLIR